MYIVQEIQTSNGQAALLPAVTKQNRNEAESAYHSIMAAAAISPVEVHSCIVYDEHGSDCTPGQKYYEHLPVQGV